VRQANVYLFSNLLLVACVFSGDADGQQAACANIPSLTGGHQYLLPRQQIALVAPEHSVCSYEGSSRCLDTPGVAGSPIFINDCAKSHLIVVEEQNDGKHTVILHAADKVIGIKSKLVNRMNKAFASDSAEVPLLLEDWSAVIGSEVNGNHLFSLDGDSIILVSDRSMVAKVQNGRGAIGSPVVLGSRQLGDNEFWDFLATEHSAIDPTSGLVRIGYNGDPYCADPATLSFPWPALETRIPKSQSPRRPVFGNRNRLSEMPTIRPSGVGSFVSMSASNWSMRFAHRTVDMAIA
jgi:hypothetical protein